MSVAALIAGVVLAVLQPGNAGIQSAAAPGGAVAAVGPLGSAPRGIAGAIEFAATGPAIRARPDQSLRSTMIVRIAEAAPQADGVTKYRLEYIGTVVGDYDLRERLERSDGSTLDIAPLGVRILSQLEPGHGTDLFSTTETPTLSATRYRALMLALAAAWAGVPIVYLAIRVMRPRPVAAATVEVREPTLADQLRPLVESAIDGKVSVADRGRLELLLYLYWRGRLGLEGRQADVIPRLRTHADAGALLRAVERWLHGRREGEIDARSEAAALLEPYRRAPAIPDVGGAA